MQRTQHRWQLQFDHRRSNQHLKNCCAKRNPRSEDENARLTSPRKRRCNSPQVAKQQERHYAVCNLNSESRSGALHPTAPWKSATGNRRVGKIRCQRTKKQCERCEHNRDDGCAPWARTTS